MRNGQHTSLLHGLHESPARGAGGMRHLRLSGGQTKPASVSAGRHCAFRPVSGRTRALRGRRSRRIHRAGPGVQVAHRDSGVPARHLMHPGRRRGAADSRRMREHLRRLSRQVPQPRAGAGPDAGSAVRHSAVRHFRAEPHGLHGG